MASFTNLVTSLSQELQSRCADPNAATVVTAFLMSHEGDFQQHFTGKPAKKQRKSKAVDPDRKKTTNWQAVWTSNANGCRAYPEFQEQLKALEESNPTMGRFEINKQLRGWAGEHGHYQTWQDWARGRLVAEGKPVPQEKGASTATTTESVVEGTVSDDTVVVDTATAAPVPMSAKASVPPVQVSAAPKPRGKAAARSVAVVAQ